MRRLAETAWRMHNDQTTDAADADEHQLLTHHDDTSNSHNVVADTSDAQHSRQEAIESTPRTASARLRYAAPSIVVLSLVLVLVVFLLFHDSTTADKATAPPHFPAVCLTSWEGQWGNIVYQLMFLLSYARRHNLTAYVRPAKPRGSNLLWRGFHVTYADELYGTQPCPWKQASAVVQVEYGKREDWADSMTVPPLEQREGSETVTVHDSSVDSRDHESGGGGHRLVVLHRGYYQFHTSGYRPHRDWLTRHMRPKADVEAVLLSLWYQLLLQLPPDTLLVAVHVRHGDYTDAVGSEFRRIPLHWYHSWIDAWLQNNASYLSLANSTPHDEIKRTLAKQQVEQSKAREWLHLDDLLHPLYSPTLRTFCRPTNHSTLTTSTSPSSPPLCVLVISDDAEVVNAFTARGYATVTPRDVLSYRSKGVALSEELSGWYVDWWLLTRVGVVATSHSSFSYTATLYSAWGDEGSFWRPDASAMRLMQYAPWDSQYVHHLFKDVVFD